MISITKTITQPEEVINAFANDLGYNIKIANPAYMVTFNDDGTSTDNGEPQTIPNPQTPKEFVSEKFDEMTLKWLSQFAERNARRATEEQLQAAIKAGQEELKKTLTTKIS